MSAADSIKLETGEAWSLTTDWQNLWELCNLKYVTDGLPPFNKHCATLRLEVPSSSAANVEWSRTSLGDNPAGELGTGDGIDKNRIFNNENMYTMYVRGTDIGAELLVERTQ